MRLRSFVTPDDLTEAVADLLCEHFDRPDNRARAVMLAGGGTPLNAYREVTRRGIKADQGLHVFLSDERIAPVASPMSNWGQILPMLDSLEMDQEKRIRVPVESNPRDAADHFEQSLQTLLSDDIAFPLGLLGIGTDGHTASLFRPDHILEAQGRLALPIARDEPPHRVSVTPQLLARIDRLVFLAAGPEKGPTVNRLLRNPDQTVAGLAVAGHPNVDLWYAS